VEDPPGSSSIGGRRAVVEFSKRIAVIAGVATWGCVVLGLVAAY
jgi:hypothetical protein